MLNRRAQLSTTVLCTIATFDLLTTIMLVMVGMREGNPLFAWLLNYGFVAFAVGKLVLLIGPILILEWVRTTKPKTAEQGTWVAVGFYALLYGWQIITLRAGTGH
ncbi:MAG: hypothetical protein KF784_08575 [Fimbriimonadaceae bacterium]|nr:hypothetical protein [Fimbriimonadaceae bacterium]